MMDGERPQTSDPQPAHTGPPMDSGPSEPTLDSLPLPKWSVGGAVGLTLLTIAATAAGGLLAAALVSLGVGPDVRAAVMGLALVTPYLAAIGVMAIAAKRKGLSLAGSVALRPVPFWQVAPLAVGVALAARLFAGLWGVLLQAFGVDLPGMDLDPTSFLPPGPIGVLFTVLAACVLAPIVEEMVFRGVLLPAFADRWGATVGIAVSSAAFAVVHIYPYAMVPIFVLAIVLARLFLRSRTLWLPIAVHAVFNTIGVVAIYALKASGRL